MSSSERYPLHISPGETFRVNPNVDQQLEDYDYGTVVDRIHFELEGFGRGHLRFIELHGGFNDTNPILFPAGRVLPFTIETTIENLSKEQVDKLQFVISYGLKEYEGIPEYDEDELNSGRVSDLDFYSYWGTTEEECNILFPREALNQVYFTFKTKWDEQDFCRPGRS